MLDTAQAKYSLAKTTARANPGPWLALPVALWFSIFLVVPLVVIIVYSLGSRDELGRVVFGFHPENYLRFYTGPYLTCLGRSLELAAGTTGICLGLAFPLAMWLAFSLPKEKQGLFVTLLTVPLWTSFLLRIYAWITILRPTGILPSLLRACGLENPPQLLYNDFAVALGMVYNYLPYMVLPLYTSLEKLDLRLCEAAADLGATNLRTILTVVIPLSARGIVAGVIFVFVPSLGDYVTPDLMGGAKLMFIGNLIQNQFLVVRDWAFGSAVSTILLLVVSLGIWVYFKYGDDPQAY